MAHYLYTDLYVEDGSVYVSKHREKDKNKLTTRAELEDAIQTLTAKVEAMEALSGAIVSKAEITELQEVVDDMGKKAEQSDVDIIKLKLSKVKSNHQGDVGINIDPIPGRGSVQIGSPRDERTKAETEDANESGSPLPHKGNNSLYCSEKIVCQDMVNFSDERIKTNIQNLKEDEALEVLRKINPRKYEYIDKMNRGASPTFGFIAQEVKQVLPDSVQIINEFIPNIYSQAHVNRNVLSLSPSFNTNTGHDISPQDIIKLIGSQGQTIVQVISVSSNKQVIVVDKIVDEPSGWVFVYGKMVQDFLTINHDSIFSLNVCATQQLDKKMVELERTIEQLKMKQVSSSKTITKQIKAQPSETNFTTIDMSIADMIDFHALSQVNNFMYRPTQDIYITPDVFGKVTINWRNSEPISKTYKVTVVFA